MKVDDTDLDNAIYAVLSSELEAMEHTGNLVGNGHHVAQRLVPLVRAAVQEVIQRASEKTS